MAPMFCVALSLLAMQVCHSTAFVIPNVKSRNGLSAPTISSSSNSDAVATPTTTSTEIDAAAFLRKVTSSRTGEAEKAEMFKAFQAVRASGEKEWTSLLDNLIEEIGKVENNKWALTKWPVPIPSYRIRLGCLNRLLKDILEEDLNSGAFTRADSQKEMERTRRAVSLLVRQLQTTAGIRSLEAEAIRRKTQSSSIEEMLARTPAGLETPAYKVLDKKETWEVRKYENFAVCSTNMAASADASADVGDQGSAFNKLAGYIFGQNLAQEKMAMTTPVISTADRSKMSFVMPSAYWGDQSKLEKAPKPIPASGVTVESGGAGLVGAKDEGAGDAGAKDEAGAGGEGVAVLWYGGYGTKDNNEKRAKELKEKIESSNEWKIKDGESYFVMQYNDPFQPPWKRRNEVAIKVIRKDS